MQKTILVVDDLPFAADVIRFFYLGRFQVVYEKNPVKALEILDKQQFDLVVLDYRMPEMDGYDFIQEYNKRFKYPVILCASSEPNRDLFKQAGVAGFLDKPFSLDTLVKEVGTILGEPQG
jgi:CheY-like chemotaxis protein